MSPFRYLSCHFWDLVICYNLCVYPWSSPDQVCTEDVHSKRCVFFKAIPKETLKKKSIFGTFRSRILLVLTLYSGTKLGLYVTNLERHSLKRPRSAGSLEYREHLSQMLFIFSSIDGVYDSIEIAAKLHFPCSKKLTKTFFK